jgi:hypothetical protein
LWKLLKIHAPIFLIFNHEAKIESLVALLFANPFREGGREIGGTEVPKHEGPRSNQQQKV